MLGLSLCGCLKCNIRFLLFFACLTFESTSLKDQWPEATMRSKGVVIFDIFVLRFMGNKMVSLPLKKKRNEEITVIILNIGTDRSEPTVQTQIRLLLMEQSDQGLLCLLFCLHLLNTILHCKIQLFQKRKYVARPGIEPRTPDLRVRCQVPYRLRYAARLILCVKDTGKAAYKSILTITFMRISS